MRMRDITLEESRMLCRFVLQHSGIAINHTKNRFLETRLWPLVDRFAVPDYLGLLALARSDASGSILQEIVDAITTNETRFFRDSGPFDLLKFKILPELVAVRKPDYTGRIPIRIWSAACATGQEAYSIAIMIKESLGDLSPFRVTLVGSDISEQALAKARKGMYSKYEVAKGMPETLLKKYFTPCPNGWQIRSDIQSMVRFESVNLTLPIKASKKWDVVFCRNVAIYFQQEQRKQLFERLADVLKFDGYLVAGASESLAAICTRFVPNMFSSSTFYQRRF